MFKDHPKGLYVLFFSNMGERFGYYTMIAIFTQYLMDHFGWHEDQASALYGYFLAGIYFMPFLGGILADQVLGYGKTITLGIVVMALGYTFLGGPLFAPVLDTPTFVVLALAVIAIGTGFFKGNLAVLVGNLYNNKSSSLKDAAFNIYYMGINIGAFFAAYAAKGIKDYLLASHGFVYDQNIPQIAQAYMKGDLSQVSLHKLQEFFGSTDPAYLKSTAANYLSTLASGYDAGFIIAGLSMVISIVIFLGFRKYYKEADYTAKDKKHQDKDIQLTPKQTKDRVIALLLIFFIVIFFWMAFHQNGSTLTFFAKKYTDLDVSQFTKLIFDIPTMLFFIGVVLSILAIFKKEIGAEFKLIGGIYLAIPGILMIYYLDEGGYSFNQLLIPIIGILLGIFGFFIKYRNNSSHKFYGLLYAVFGALFIYSRYNSFGPDNQISPELFQSFNPYFIIFMTPIVVSFFAWLNKRSKEPDPPAKIGIGMFITAIGFTIMIIASLGLPSVGSLGEQPSSVLMSPYYLISTYFVLTIAELFLSPMGLSFVAKVSPPKMRGMMQGGWLAATAIGNYLAGFIGRFYKEWELWQFFLLVVVTSLVSVVMLLAALKKIRSAISS